MRKSENGRRNRTAESVVPQTDVDEVSVLESRYASVEEIVLQNKTSEEFKGGDRIRYWSMNEV